MEIIRMLLLLVHLLCVITAAIGIAFADFSIFRGRTVDRLLLRRATHVVLVMLALLWVTGLSITWIDTRFVLADIAARPKLVAKIGVALLLTLNGVLLHRFFFRSLIEPQPVPPAAATLAAALSAVSGASWLYALFLGLAKPLAPLLGLGGFVAVFGVLLAAAAAVVALVVKPRLEAIYLSLPRM